MLLLIRPSAGAPGAPTPGPGEVTQVVTVDPGTTLRLRADLYATASTSADAFVFVSWLDATGSVLGVGSSLRPTLTGVWQTVVGDFTAPPLTASALVTCKTSVVGSGVGKFDNVSLTVYSTPSLLFSGPLTNVRLARSAGPYRHADVTGTGWGLYLDNRAVTTLSWVSADKDDTIVMRTVRQFGGPLLANAADINGIGTIAGSDGSAVKTTVRGVLSTVADQFDAGYRATRFYVDNERGIHWWYDDADEAAVAGTATSIGDEGALQPEYLTYETGAEGYRGLAAAYNTSGTFVGWAPNEKNGTGPTDWEAGEPSIIYDEPYALAATVEQASGYLSHYHSDVTSITFSTIEDSSFRPHMKITVDDSLLTDGAAETFYISDVSGTIDERKVIELEVSLGARARSIVQTVAGNL